MPTAFAVRSFDHNGKIAKGDDLSDKFDIITLRALKRSGLITLIEDGEEPAKTVAPKAPVPTVGSLGKAPQPKRKPRGGKPSASPAAQALQPPTLPQSTPGALPPPLPVE